MVCADDDVLLDVLAACRVCCGDFLVGIRRRRFVNHASTRILCLRACCVLRFVVAATGCIALDTRRLCCGDCGVKW